MAMNNEPVAWINELDLQILENNLECMARIYRDEPIKKDWVPLYTHPAKTLTDEEIEAIANANVDGHSSMEQLKWFARAILRKAQEK
jgi:hypothetical protein